MEPWIPILYGGMGAVTLAIGALIGGTLVATGYRQIIKHVPEDEEGDGNDAS